MPKVIKSWPPENRKIRMEFHLTTDLPGVYSPKEWAEVIALRLRLLGFNVVLTNYSPKDGG